MILLIFVSGRLINLIQYIKCYENKSILANHNLYILLRDNVIVLK